MTKTSPAVVDVSREFSTSQTIPIILQEVGYKKNSTLARNLATVAIVLVVALSISTFVLAIQVYGIHHSQPCRPPPGDNGNNGMHGSGGHHGDHGNGHGHHGNGHGHHGGHGNGHGNGHHESLKWKLPKNQENQSPVTKPWQSFPNSINTGKDTSNFTFDDMFNPSFWPRSPQAAWANGVNKVYYVDGSMNLILHDVDTNATEILVDAEAMMNLLPDMFFLAPDQKYVLFTYDQITEVQTANLWARFKIYDVGQRVMLDFPNDEAIAGKMLLYAGWAPTGHGLTFIYGDDLYHQADPYTKSERLTTSGANHKVRNGQSFWNTQGALWSFPMHWWSSDLRYLAYGSFNSTEVYMSEHPVYGPYSNVYPYTFNQVYLKAGDAAHFSYGSLHIMDMGKADRPEIVIQPPEELRNLDHYIQQVAWRDPDHLAVVWCNRPQTYNIMEICNVQDSSCVRNHEYDYTKNGGWIRFPPVTMFLDGGEAAIGILPKAIGEEGTFQQVALLATPTDNQGSIVYLTDEDREVLDIIGYDSQRHLVYYSAPGENQLSRHVFRVGTPSADPDMQAVTCLTCDFLAPDCQYNTASFSSNTDYHILNCLGPEVPKYFLLSTLATKNTRITLEDNKALQNALQAKNMPTRQWHLVDLADGYQGWVELILPPSYNDAHPNEYSLLLYPYAGPHGHTQADFTYKSNYANQGGWENYLASSEGVVVARINGRGTGSRGDRWLYHLYRRLATDEIQDQIYGAKSVSEKFSFIDGNRIGVWGWSYGGFTTTHVIGDPSEIIKCGLAVAPVTNFRWYYAAYTEKFMGLDTPQDNQAGYNATACTRKTENFKGKKYFLAHGTLDDNVHFQHATQMIRALTDAQELFISYIYVDENHSIRSLPQNRHLFLAMTDFIRNQCSLI